MPSPFTLHDIRRLAPLQPDGWPPLGPAYVFYTGSSFCFPIKHEVDGELAGIGCAILLGRTGWTGHIVTNAAFRNRGIGTLITQTLVDMLHQRKARSISLIATAMGEPVYRRVGFQKESEYHFFKGGTMPCLTPDITQPYTDAYSTGLLALDCATSGEVRADLLQPHLATARLTISDQKLQGAYLPTLGEGLIMAHTPEAGFALMQLRKDTSTYHAIPEKNLAAIDLLTSHGYTFYRTGHRMWMGERIMWEPTKLFGRIGGNLG